MATHGHPLSWHEDRIGVCRPGDCEALLRQLLRLGYLRQRLRQEGPVTAGRLVEIVRQAPDWAVPRPAARRGDPSPRGTG